MERMKSFYRTLLINTSLIIMTGMALSYIRESIMLISKNVDLLFLMAVFTIKNIVAYMILLPDNCCLKTVFLGLVISNLLLAVFSGIAGPLFEFPYFLIGPQIIFISFNLNSDNNKKLSMNQQIIQASSAEEIPDEQTWKIYSIPRR